MIFIDTNVFVAAALRKDPRREDALRVLEGSTPATHATAAHCLAEVFSQLTGIRQPKLISPKIASATVVAYAKRLTVVALTAEETLAAIETASRNGIAGGTIYDALIVSCALKAGATSILTYNTSDFIRVAPTYLVDSIRQP